MKNHYTLEEQKKILLEQVPNIKGTEAQDDAPSVTIYKLNRLRMLVAQRSITQPEANQLWREYLRGIIPVGKIPKIRK